jgi:hypothetical protein
MSRSLHPIFSVRGGMNSRKCFSTVNISDAGECAEKMKRIHDKNACTFLNKQVHLEPAFQNRKRHTDKVLIYFLAGK